MDPAPDASPAAIAGLAQIALTMADVPAELIFYRDTLGLRLLFSAGPDLAVLEAGGVRLMLTTRGGTESRGRIPLSTSASKIWRRLTPRWWRAERHRSGLRR